MLNAELRNQLLLLSTPLIADARVRLGLPESHLDSSIRPVLPFSRMAGSAVTVLLDTVESETGLQPMLRAYESADPDAFSVMVIQVPSPLHGRGIFGGGAATLCRQHGFVGALIDGAVRDTHELNDMQFPAFSRTIAPGYIVGKCSAVAVGEPVQIGGQTVHADDIIMADNDGVIILRPGELLEVVSRAQAIKEWEERFHRLIADGTSAEETSKLAGPMP
jgi:4-hydroxy-4-methyl-2-oxoglutarate aldolase